MRLLNKADDSICFGENIAGVCRLHYLLQGFWEKQKESMKDRKDPLSQQRQTPTSVGPWLEEAQIESCPCKSHIYCERRHEDLTLSLCNTREHHQSRTSRRIKQIKYEASKHSYSLWSNPIPWKITWKSVFSWSHCQIIKIKEIL